MQITDIKIRKIFTEGPMKAVVSVSFDDELVVHDIKIINPADSERFFCVMPSKKLADESFCDIAHPINSLFRRELEKAILEAYHVRLAAEQEINE